MHLTVALCDYWLNGYIKGNLIDQANEKCLIRMVSKVVKNVPEEEYKKAFNKLSERIKFCINNYGDYFEHLIK